MDVLTIDDIIVEALNRNASDIHIKAGKPPYLRIYGDLKVMDLPPFDKTTVTNLIQAMLSDEQKAALLTSRELDFSYRSSQEFQFRVNVCYSQGLLAANIRITAAHIKTLEELALPRVVNDLCMKRKGLIIISGTAGSGKTTTLTYMVDFINRERKFKVITIEDPIEYYHVSQNSMVLQREVGSDTNSFNDALKYALRQDPDVLVIGEMRDLDSISMALTSAETGHLVLTTVHASDAVETINRIIDVFPMDRRQQIHVQLAGNLVGVVSQSLVPLKSGSGRALATEVMVATVAIQNLILRGALNEIHGQMDSDENGMSHSLERSLANMVLNDVITKASALQYTKNPHALDYFIRTGATASPDTFSKEQWEELFERTVVVIDRDLEQRMHVESKLRSKGFKNVTGLAKNKDTVERIQKIRPDIIILDMGYEFMSTFDFCREIKAIPYKPRLLLMAETLQSNDASTAQAVGAQGFVVKTIECELLVKAMTKLDFSSFKKAAAVNHEVGGQDSNQA